MQLKPGTLLQGGKYRIEKVLGQGGFGITYLAEQSGLDRKVAVKEFFMKEHCNRDGEASFVSVPSEGSKDLVETFRQKFIKEAKTIAAMENHHIIRIIEVFEENGTAYYVMEYLSGGSLSDRIPSGGLPESEAVGYIRQVAEALAYIHQHNILHLDVKPSNILFRKEDEAVLIDFGISKHYDDEGGSQTSSTPVCVSEGYAPTEQYEHEGVSSFFASTDIYSLGATLYCLLSGHRPPKASIVLNDGLPPLPSSVSASTRVAVETAMSPKRKDRPQSVGEFLKLLDNPVVIVSDEETKTVDSSSEKSDSSSSGNSETSGSSSGSYDHNKPYIKKWLWPLLTGFAVVVVVLLAVFRPFEPDALSSDLFAYKEYLHQGDSLSMHEESLSEAISAYDSASAYEQKYSGSRYSRRFRGAASSKSASVQSRIDSIRVSDSLAKIAAFKAAEVEAETISVPETDPLASQWENDLREYSSLMEMGDEYSKSDATLSQSKSKYEQALKFEMKYSGSKYSDKFSKGASKSLKSVESRIKEKEEADAAAAAAARAEADRLAKEQKAREESERKQKEESERKRDETSYTNGILRVKGVEYPMVYVSGGSFMMGSEDSDADSDEKPVHRVTLNSYSIGKYEVTQDLWEAVMGSNPSDFKGSRRPVEEVSWNDCQDFIRKLNELTGANFRLPTEAEWEFAARGGNSSRGYKYSGSNTLDNVAWYRDNSGSETHDVGTKSPNELGLYDMSGNVWEWCNDRDGRYSSSSQTDPKGASSGSIRVIRGGGWSNNARICRVSNRGFSTPGYRDDNMGLRLCH